MDPLQNQQGMAAALMQPQGQQPPAQNPADLFVSMGEQQGSYNKPQIVPDDYTPPQQMNLMQQMAGMDGYPQNPFSQSGPLAGVPQQLNTNAQYPMSTPMTWATPTG